MARNAMAQLLQVAVEIEDITHEAACSLSRRAMCGTDSVRQGSGRRGVDPVRAKSPDME